MNVYQSAQAVAAVTKYHGLSGEWWWGLKQQKLISSQSGGWTSKSRVSARPSSPGVFTSPSLCVQMSRF